MSIQEETIVRVGKVRKALEENRVRSIKWNSDGSGCEFIYHGMDNHGMPCLFSSHFNKENSIKILSGIMLDVIKEGGPR